MRDALLSFARAGIAAVEPGRAVSSAVRREPGSLVVGGEPVPLDGFDNALVLAFGKASLGMARAVLPLLDGLPVRGVAVAPDVYPVPPLAVVAGNHPVPAEDSLAAGRILLDQAGTAGPEDLVLVLISGGGSALVAAPTPPLTLADLDATNSLLLGSGAPIESVNTVRKHLSDFKGGGLARAAADAGTMVTLIISDVIGNDPSAIASGPTVPDPTTFGDALNVLDRHDLRSQVPHAVRTHLEAGAEGAVEETPKEGAIFERQTLSVIADGPAAAEAAANAARDAGHRARIVTTTLRGEARKVARSIVDEVRAAAVGEVLIYAGETTVTLRGDGSGGRNQELALAGSLLLDEGEAITILSIGSDGIDGPTETAGGFSDGSAAARARAAGIDLSDHLERNDSNPALTAIGDAVVTGPTGTNVGDLVLAVRHGE